MKPSDELLNQITSPGRYLPLELFAYRKDPAAARLTVALAFPDVYEVGMSHLGVRILYHLLNEQDEIACDRAYAPWPDMEAAMRSRGLPLSGHESGLALKDFDVVGFSMSYELSFTNILNMLDLGGIPLLASDRESGRWPLVIGGGPCASNPEPLADFFDAFLFGDGEEALPEICAAALAAKESKATRQELLDQLAEIEGVYVPSLFAPEYGEDGRVRSVRPLGRRSTVRRRLVADLEGSFFPDHPLVPALEPVHDRVMVEVARGCTRGCRFCHAGMICRPYRERSAGRVFELARKSLLSTGYEEISLLSLSMGDYSCISELLVSLMREHYPRRVSVSLPSLRVQGLSDEMLRAIETVRKTGFTLAPEAGTERLRRVINKSYPEEEFLETARRVFGHGWRTLKLYFMIGLPTEQDEDIDGIVRMAELVSGMRGSQGRPQVSLSVSGFVPKAHTPFQWESQADPERLRAVISHLKGSFSGKHKQFKWADPAMTALEGVMARGDRRVGRAVLAAFRRGLRFDGWSEKYNREGWQEALAESGIDPAFYTTRVREPGEAQAWDHLESGIGRDWLLSERERAYGLETTPDCRVEGCVNSCGACDHDRIKPRCAGPSGLEVGPPSERKAEPEVYFLYRVRYARRGDMKFIGQLEVTRMFGRLIRRSELPIRYSQGFHPLPRIMFGPPPPVGVASEAEYVDLELVSRLTAEEVRDRLAGGLPPGVELIWTREIPMRSPSITSMIQGFDYRVKAAGMGEVFRESAAGEFLAAESWPIHQKRAKGDREVDLRPLVKFLTVLGPSELEMGIRSSNGPGVKPQEVVGAVFGLADDRLKALDIVREQAWLKEAKPIRYSGGGERKARRGPGS